MSQDQNAGRNRNIKNNNSSFERVEQSKYLRTTSASTRFNVETLCSGHCKVYYTHIINIRVSCKLAFPTASVQTPSLLIVQWNPPAKFTKRAWRNDKTPILVPCRHHPSSSSSSSSSSSYCWATAANALNALQPYWIIVLPLDIPALTTSLLYEILAARGGIIYIYIYIYTFLFLDVPTFATSRLREILAAKVKLHGREMIDEFSLKMPDFHVAFIGTFTCSKSTTWHWRLYFPYEGRRAEDFFFRPEKSDGFGLVWTRQLGYQMPARYL